MNVKETQINLKNREYILDCIILLIIVQVSRVIIKYVFLSQLNFTLDNINIVNIISIMLVGIIMTMILRSSDLFNSAGKRLIKLNNKHNNKNIRLILGAITSVAICITPYFDGGYLPSNLIILTLALIVEPVFEEVIFREYLWNYVESFQKDERKVLIIVTILSALFKVGYWDMISQSLSVVGSSLFTVDIVMYRVFIGLIVSFILGLLKIKYKDTYLCIFVHSLINIFIGR
ncbi:CPBP family intramembrane glutamic endopeptidase [Terrisporobacter sp.]